jgi:hypothetical protein
MDDKWSWRGGRKGSEDGESRNVMLQVCAFILKIYESDMLQDGVYWIFFEKSMRIGREEGLLEDGLGEGNLRKFAEEKEL